MPEILLQVRGDVVDGDTSRINVVAATGGGDLDGIHLAVQPHAVGADRIQAVDGCVILVEHLHVAIGA